jgi:hypothetical protein
MRERILLTAAIVATACSMPVRMWLDQYAPDYTHMSYYELKAIDEWNPLLLVDDSMTAEHIYNRVKFGPSPVAK